MSYFQVFLAPFVIFWIIGTIIWAVQKVRGK